MTKSTLLDARALFLISGGEALDFLQNLVTCDVEKLSEGDATFGALLTPQGKIHFDFFLVRNSDGFIVDVEKTQREAIIKRLTFYKLRADVAITPIDDLKVYVMWDGDLDSGFPDPRLQMLGNRLFASEFETNSSAADWKAHRIGLGIPESGTDFELGEAFPHEVLMDQFPDAGVDFSKGCYVGQEVVSRMQHRGTARSRWIEVESDKSLPAVGTNIEVEKRTIGSMGSSSVSIGLAVVRLDRAKAAIDADKPIVAGDTALRLKIPSFATFGWPE